MTYETHSPVGPHTDTGILPGLIQYISHNPTDTDRVPSFPTLYPDLVRPTNDKMAPVFVPDEFHLLTDIDTGNNNRLRLNHRPQAGTTYTISGGGVIDENLTDRENWLIYFTTLPSADFTVQYFSEPDKYYGEILEPIQDILMKICILLGAGSDTGLLNAQLFVNELPDELKTKLPNAINFQAVDRDITLRSSTDPGAPGGTVHTFTIGNSEDALILDLAAFKFYNSGVDEVIGEYGSKDIDRHLFRGKVYMGDSGTYPDAFNYDVTAGHNHDLIVSRDALVGGNLYVMGSQVNVNGTTTVDVDVSQGDKTVSGDLNVHGDVTLGDSTLDTVDVKGNLNIEGKVVAKGITGDHEFDRSIVFTDGATRGVSNHVSEIDGLDPSTIELVRKYYAGDYRRGTIIDGVRGPFRTGLTSGTGTSSEIVDGSISAVYTSNFGTGHYYFEKFRRDPGWYAVILNGPDVGTKRRIVDFNTGTKIWTVARPFPSGALAASTSFRIYHDAGQGSYFTIGGALTMNINCSTVFPLVAEKNGVIKVRTTPTTVVLPGTTGTYYVYMNMATATGSPESAEPTFFYTSYPNPSETSVLIGEVGVSAGSISWSHGKNINRRFDSLWIKFDTAASGWTRLWGSSWTWAGYYHSSDQRSPPDVKVKMLISPHDAGNNGPTYSDQKIVSPEDVGVHFNVGTGGISIDTSAAPASYFGNSLPFWMRFITE